MSTVALAIDIAKPLSFSSALWFSLVSALSTIVMWGIEMTDRRLHQAPVSAVAQPSSVLPSSVIEVSLEVSNEVGNVRNVGCCGDPPFDTIRDQRMWMMVWSTFLFAIAIAFFDSYIACPFPKLM